MKAACPSGAGALGRSYGRWPRGLERFSQEIAPPAGTAKRGPLRCRSWRALATALCFATLGARSAAADTLVTVDGRIVECREARESAAGYALTFEHGSIEVPRSAVAEVVSEDGLSDYVPQNEDERQKLAEGFVRYRGKWMSKAAYLAETKRRNEERRLRFEERKLHTDFVNAWEKETKHFRLKTNTSPELLDYYGELLETYWDLMDKRVGIDPSPTLRRTKMTVNIYKSHQEFVELSAAGVDYSTLGYFWAQDQTLNFFHDYQEPKRSEWVALHECTHLLTYLIDPQFSPSAKSIWINEGVADLFGSSEVRRDKKGKLEIVPGKLQTDRVLTVQQAIKDGTDTKLEQLLKLLPKDFDGFQYAHAWSFVYFLTQDARYEKGFTGFFHDLYALKVEKKDVEPGADKSGVQITVPPDEVRRLLLKRLGLRGTEDLEREWKAFVAAIPIEAPEARFQRAYRMARFGQGLSADPARSKRALEEARADLDFAIQSGFEDARAYWARGLFQAYALGRLAEGVEDFRRAIELDPLNPAYRFDLAQTLCGALFSVSIGSVRVALEGERKLSGTPEELAEAKAQFGLAYELDPESDLYADSYEQFQALEREHENQ